MVACQTAIAALCVMPVPDNTHELWRQTSACGGVPTQDVLSVSTERKDRRQLAKASLKIVLESSNERQHQTSVSRAVLCFKQFPKQRRLAGT
jgi:hypothetical protein